MGSLRFGTQLQRSHVNVHPTCERPGWWQMYLLFSSFICMFFFPSGFFRQFLSFLSKCILNNTFLLINQGKAMALGASGSTNEWHIYSYKRIYIFYAQIIFSFTETNRRCVFCFFFPAERCGGQLLLICSLFFIYGRLLRVLTKTLHSYHKMCDKCAFGKQNNENSPSNAVRICVALTALTCFYIYIQF